MDIRTGKTYVTREEALAAGVPASDVAKVTWTRGEPVPHFRNPRYPRRYQGERETARRRRRLEKAGV